MLFSCKVQQQVIIISPKNMSCLRQWITLS